MSPLRSTGLMVALAGSCWLPAQAAARGPERPLLHVAIGGPAVWRAQLAPTNLGSLLASGGGRELWQPLIGSVEGALAPWFADDAAFAASRGRFLDYAGVLDVRLWLDGGRCTAELRLLPDGRTDLGALAADLARAVAGAYGREFAPVDGTTFRGLDLDLQGTLLTAPSLVGDGDDAVALAVVAPRERVGDIWRAAAAAGARAAAQPSRETQPLSLSYDVGQALLDVDEGDALTGLLIDVLGVRSLRRVELTLAAAGPHVSLELAQRFGEAPAGLFAALFPDRQGLPAIARLRPTDGAAWKAGHLDHDAMYAFVSALFDRFTTTFARRFERDLGDDREAVLANMASGYLMLGSLGDRRDRALDDDDTAFSIAFPVEDEAVADRFRRALRDGIGFTEHEQDPVELDGHRIHRFGGWFEGSAAVGHGLLVLGFGTGSPAQAAALLSAARDRPTWAAEAAAPDGLTEALRHAPPGLNGAAHADVAAMWTQLGLLLALLDEVLDHDLAAEVDAWLSRDRDGLRALLTEHRLLTARSLTGYHDGVWRFRLLW